MMNIRQYYDAIGGSYQQALDQVCGREAALIRYVRRFAEDETFDALAHAVDAGDVAAVFRAAHTLKGLCLTLRFDAMSPACAVLTELARPSVDGIVPEVEAAQLREAFEAVEAEYLRVVAAIGLLV